MSFNVMSLKMTTFLFLILFVFQAANAWEVDFSRRTKKKQNSDSQSATAEEQSTSPTANNPPPASKAKLADFVSKVQRETVVDRQELVILNTGKGFIPSNVRVKKGVHYMIHIVNVNKENKNVSFMLDAFAQHHSTYYGETKSFKFDPDKEGVFEFQCPETSAEGKLVVYGPQSSPVQADRSTAATE